jgi:WD40 repeat protein
MTAANLLRVRALAFRPDGAMLAVAGDERIVRLWSFPEGKRQMISLNEMLEPNQTLTNPYIKLYQDSNLIADGYRVSVYGSILIHSTNF